MLRKFFMPSSSIGHLPWQPLAGQLFTLATIDLHSHGDVIVIGPGMNSDVASSYGRTQNVVHNRVLV